MQRFDEVEMKWQLVKAGVALSTSFCAWLKIRGMVELDVAWQGWLCFGATVTCGVLWVVTMVEGLAGRLKVNVKTIREMLWIVGGAMVFANLLLPIAEVILGWPVKEAVPTGAESHGRIALLAAITWVLTEVGKKKGDEELRKIVDLQCLMALCLMGNNSLVLNKKENADWLWAAIMLVIGLIFVATYIYERAKSTRHLGRRTL